MVVGFTDITANIHTDMVDFKAAVVAGFTDITTNITAVVTDFKAAVVAGFADISANFQLAIDNLNINIQNFFNKKMEDLPEPTPTPSPTPEPSNPTPSPSPSPAPLDPILPETQNLIIPKMNSNSFADEHGTWIASGSSKYSDVFDFFHAFDRSTSDFGRQMQVPLTCKLRFPTPKIITLTVILCGFLNSLTVTLKNGRFKAQTMANMMIWTRKKTKIFRICKNTNIHLPCARRINTTA